MKKVSYKSWLTWVFDHPVRKKPWYYKYDIPHYDKDDAQNLAHLTRLFNAPLPTLAQYTDAQIGQGIWFIAQGLFSNHLFCFSNDELPATDRLAGIEAMNNLYRRLFAVKCTPHLSHLDEPRANPINQACYMWWDLAPLVGSKHRKDKPFDKALLQVMANALALDHDACRESALHGLGHWHQHYPAFVRKTVEQFLRRHPHLRPELKDYAALAMSGCMW